MKNSFASVCREWRTQRRYSQLQLALELSVSSKHISFIETGRSMASREMVLKIGAFLFLPQREINRGLYAAGYAPVYRALSPDDEQLKPVFDAIDQMLNNHLPYPALVLNQHWDVVNANSSAQELLTVLGFSGSNNLIESIIFDDPETSKIVNWRATALNVLVRLRHEISVLGGETRLEELASMLASRLAPIDDLFDINASSTTVSIELRLEDAVISFFSIMAQLSTVQDVTVSEYKVELMFPADDTTKTYYSK